MPTQTTSQSTTQSTRGRKRALSTVTRESSEDSAESEEVEWEWIYNTEQSEHGEDDGDRKRRKVTASSKIIGARYGDFECRVGDTVMLKADGSNGTWVAIICDFREGADNEGMAANFMWFLTEKEILNKDRKRKDFYWVSANTITLCCVVSPWYPSPNR